MRRGIGWWGAATLGCSVAAMTGWGSVAAAEDATTIVRQAASSTARARSFEFGVGPGGAAATITYQAPNRFRLVEHGLSVSAAHGTDPTSPPQPSTITTIYIGATRYVSTSESRLYRKEALASNAPSPANLLRYLRRLAQAGRITRTGSIYHFRVTRLPPRPGTPAISATGDATVANGYLKTFTIRFDETGPGAAMGGSFDKINHAPPVAAPPRTQVAPSRQ